MIRLIIREAAEREGVSNPNVLAQLTGLPYETCRRLWRGDNRMIHLDILERICTALDIRPSQLIDYQAEPEKLKLKRKRRKRAK